MLQHKVDSNIMGYCNDSKVAGTLKKATVFRKRIRGKGVDNDEFVIV